MKTTLKKLRACAHRPFTQVLLLIILVGASSSATERLIKLYRDGVPVSLGVIACHVLAIGLLVVTMKHFDRIEARMKAGDAA